ncbi:hypothetical protein F5Y16DRAFT_192065 [Xylariaceae sp. FL0255]|nr:hypothetical protein F5Y16DRAFT_192065 [Xylariaceae sp. FL0255]
MQTLNRSFEQLFVPLGERRSRSDLATCTLDLTWSRSEKACAPRGTKAYPSPPMSGSPPLPPKPNQEVTERGQRRFQASGHDAYRTGPMLQGGDYRSAPPQPPLPPPHPAVAGRFPLEAPERLPYPSYRRQEETHGPPISYPPPSPGPMVPQPQPQYPLPPAAGPSLGPSPYPMPLSQPAPINPPFTSPKSQRKTKGHVAAACVPCKKAHLRCDAQRPCSRCLSSGKEDACVDVQHKKRGRPRLRDERETRFDSGRPTQLPADSNIRRPLSLYTPVTTAPPSFDDAIRRSHSYRVLKSQPTESVAPRFLSRGSISDANVYPGPLSIATMTPEPVAFLTIGDLEVVTASSTFIDATMANSQSVLGYRSQPVVGRKLVDMITPPERDRVNALCKSLQSEQAAKEPNYLPPIFGKKEEERVIKAQSFGVESVSRYLLDREEFFTFVAADGQPRPHSVRVGLAKAESIYFVILLLGPAYRSFPHPSPSPRSRDVLYPQQPQVYSQLTPVSASFEPVRSHMGDNPREAGYMPRQTDASIHLGSALSPGVSPNIPSYAASAAVLSEPAGSLAQQTPRSEHSHVRPPQQTELQLPPIRGPQQSVPSGDRAWQREDRSSRVDIGGLIEKPGPPPGRNP